MQKDMHYCCVKMLVGKAGFSLEEAELIAYPSQYTDDAIMHKGIKIYDLPDFAKPLVRKDLFEPICTAHKGLDLISGFWPDTQKKVFIPYHYLPSEQYSGQGAYDYRTVAGSDFAAQLLQRAVDFFQDAQSDFNRRFSLIRLGIALHTYFDTWSHVGFSGRWDQENDLSNVKIKRRDKRENFSDFGPDIGHAEIGNMPDWPFANWKAENFQGQQIGSNNPTQFLIAANMIYDFLRQLIGNAPGQFDAIQEKLKAFFKLEIEDEKKRVEKWRLIFSDSLFFYDESAWEKAAIGSPLPYDQFESRKYPGVYRYQYQGDDRWLLFHLAAAEQRQWVLERIKSF